MNTITHFLIGWSTANVDGIERRDRFLVTIGGILPDIDSFGILPEILTGKKPDWFSQYHHLLAHNLLVAVVGLTMAVLLAHKRFVTGLLFFLAFHRHLLGDVLGGRGPDGYQWPIPYLWLFSDGLQITRWSQWSLNAWPDFVITILFIIITLWLARHKGYSPVSLFSTKADKAVVKIIEK